MASKWREFWLNPNPDNRGWSKGPPHKYLAEMNPYGLPIHVIEKAALDDALELINEIEKIANGMLGKNAGSIIGKIKAFKDRGSE